MTFEPSFEEINRQNSLSTIIDNENGIFTLNINDGSSVLSTELIAHLVQRLKELKSNGDLRVLIIKSTAESFLQGGRDALNNAIDKGLLKSIITFPYPIIAAMEGNARGAGMLVGVLCDFIICCQSSEFNFTDINESVFPTIHEDLLFRERFGDELANTFLYRAPTYTGAQLKSLGFSFPIVECKDVMEQAHKISLKLNKKSPLALRLLKEHLNKSIVKHVEKLEEIAISQFDCNDEIQPLQAITSPSKLLRVKTSKEGSITITLCKNRQNLCAVDIIEPLSDVFRQIKKTDAYKSIILRSEHNNFFPGIDSDSINTVLDIQEMLLNCPLPIIALLESDTSDKAWYLHQFFDIVIYQNNKSYSIKTFFNNGIIDRQAIVMFTQRFGWHYGRDILLTGHDYSGEELKRKVPSIISVEKELLIPSAIAIADFWAKIPRKLLHNWKFHSTNLVKEKIEKFPEWVESISIVDMESKTREPVLLTLKTDVISATLSPDGILLIKMQNREMKNLFSDELVAGLNDAFAYAQSLQNCKVVLLTGYDQYFATGGTKENLLDIQKGKSKFTDNNVCQLPLNCTVPVISAVQGHAIGGGWTLGMFADFVFLSEESKYFNPYMDYNFTPGAGATYVFVKKCGYDLARESLLCAHQYDGEELKEYGLSVPIIPRNEILEKAFVLAKSIVKNSRKQLIEFKNLISFSARESINDVYARELAMHDKTFVGKADTLIKIENTFNTKKDNIQSSNIINKNKNYQILQNQNDGKRVEMKNCVSLSELLVELKELLAQELHMNPDDVDENREFIDLGMDSITSVTWIRKINERYDILIEATKVYSYPTLTKLNHFIKNEIEKKRSSAGIISNLRIEIPTVQDKIETNKNVPPVVNKQVDFKAKIKKLLANELHMNESDIDDNKEFIDLGLDSITGVTLIRKINEQFDILIDATKVYSFPTVTLLSEFVNKTAEKTCSIDIKRETDDVEIPINKSASSKGCVLTGRKLVSLREKNKITINTGSHMPNSSRITPIAVIGMAGQFPQSKNIEELWKNIANGKNCISEIPGSRWNVEFFYQEGNPAHSKTNSKWMGLLEEYDKFDPLFFNISPTEAISMDPQQRLFLQAAWHAVEDAGYNPRSLSGLNCGVFVGCGHGDYLLLSKELQTSALGFSGGDTSILAARISYLLNLKGPALSLETACSSSLVAISMACDQLAYGKCDSMLAGGVYVMAGPEMHIKTSQMGMLSQDGKCHTFDQSANGFVPGEGVGVVMLKRLSDAERDHDNIIGVIKGWGTNQDGKTNGITAPNPEAQEQLEKDVYEKYHINPADIQLIEAHGTGTKLGDPIEVNALKQAFMSFTDKKDYCALGSVKSNIGHCLTAAGVAGFIKLLLSLKYKQLPPTINFKKLNEHISLDGSPFYINDKLKSWNLNNSSVRQAAISAFGFSGTNAHIVIAEYIPERENHAVLTMDSPHMIILSARNESQLKQKVHELYIVLNNRESECNISDIAYTLQVGREPMEERIGFLVRSNQELRDSLKDYLDNTISKGAFFSGRVRQNKGNSSLIFDGSDKDRFEDGLISQNDKTKILDSWVKGLDFNWNKLYTSIKPYRISLPGYPFEKNRYWVDNTDNILHQNSYQLSQVIHPLVHVNTSNFYQQSFTSSFTGKEFFLRDHQIAFDRNNAYCVLPGVVYLEMARVAVEQAMPFNKEEYSLELRNTIWIQPFIVDHQKQISVTLSLQGKDKLGNELVHFSFSSENNGLVIEHCHGQAALIAAPIVPQINLDNIRARVCKEQFETNIIYSVFKETGFNYGPAHQSINKIFKGDNELLAVIMIPSIIKKGKNDFILHPSLFDGVLQSSIGLTGNLKDRIVKPYLPFELDSLRIITECQEDIFAWIRLLPSNPVSEKILRFDIDLCDNNGNVCTQMRGFSSKLINKDGDSTLSTIYKNNDLHAENDSFNMTYYQNLIESFLKKEVTLSEAIELV